MASRFSSQTSIWLRRQPVEGAVTTLWILLASDGSPRGAVALPVTAQPLWSRGDQLLASVLDELEVPWLVRLELDEAD